MTSRELEKFVGDVSLSIVECMEKIDSNARGILFLVNRENQLVGCVTDGDIRRWIINTGDLSSPVSNAMMKTPKYLLKKDTAFAEVKMQNEGIRALPILDDCNHIMDIIFGEFNRFSNPSKFQYDMSDVSVVIMAGGKGTRLYPYTKILPKPLIPIGETPIVERIINSFAQYGVQKFYMTVNYKRKMIQAYFSELNPNYTINYVVEDKPLGTGGGLRLIKENLDTPLIVTNCDILVRIEYDKLYKYHLESGNDITIVSALKNITVPYGVVEAKQDGEIEEIKEKPKNTYFVNTGMYVINPSVIEDIPNGEVFHMTTLAEKIMKTGRVGMYPISEDSFLDMGEFSEMKRMEEKLNVSSNL